MSNDILNTKLPNDDFNAADSNFANDTSVNGADPEQLAYSEPDEGTKQLIAVDQEILDNLYPSPKPGEFVFGRNIEKGMQGINSNALGIIVGHIPLPVTPTISENTQNTAGMYGQRWLGNNYGAKVFNIPVTVIANNGDEYMSNIEQMSNALISLGNQEVPLVFGAYPDRTYYGHFTAIPEPAYINPGAWDSTLTLQFTCSDPHGYLDQETGQTDNQNRMNISVVGNDTAKPVFQYEFNKDSNNFGYTNDKGEYVFVGYSNEDNPTDLVPLVYNEPFEDSSTFTKITDMSTQKWALANGVATDGAVSVYQGWAIRNDNYWTAPHDYDGTTTAYGNVLMTNKFNIKNTDDWRISTRLSHARYYDRAYQRIEAYIIDETGNKIGRFGIRDYGGGGLTEIYILFGATIAEEQANIINGFGYSGTGNTEWARAQINQKPGKAVTLDINVEEPNMSVDKIYKNTMVQGTYDTSSWNWNINQNKIQYGTEWKHTYNTTETWKTPRDTSGKATGSQVYTKKVDVDNLTSTKVPLNQIVNGKGKKFDFHSWRDSTRETRVYNSQHKSTNYWSTWHDDGVWKNGKWNWTTTNYRHGTWINNNDNRATEVGTVTSQSKEYDWNDYDALTNFWGNFVITKLGRSISIKVNEVGNSGLQTNNVVLDATFNLPDSFNSKPSQIAYFFGKTPIHEDKITKTTPASSDIPASYEYVKTYTDDFLFVSTLYVNAIVTADALKKAHTIIHAGDTATIDTETENVYINGALANQYLSPASTYPLFHGGSQEQISFQPTADKASVTYVYRPALK